MTHSGEELREISICIKMRTTPGFTRLRMSDTYAQISTDDGRKIGGVGGCVGGAIQVDVDGDEYVINPKALFNAVSVALGKSEYCFGDIEKPEPVQTISEMIDLLELIGGLLAISKEALKYVPYRSTDQEASRYFIAEAEDAIIKYNKKYQNYIKHGTDKSKIY